MGVSQDLFAAENRWLLFINLGHMQEEQKNKS